MVYTATSCCGLGFILRSFGRIMGCLFRCFCVPDDTPPPSRSNNRKDHLVSQNRLASLLVSEREGEGFSCKDKKVDSLDSPCQDSNERELKEEARFLKSCGTILETPVEFRKTSERLPHNEDSETSKFHSWLPNTSIEELQWEGQASQLSVDPVKLCNGLRKESGSPSTPEELALTNQCKNKSVRFELESDKAFLPSSAENTNQSDSPGNCNELKRFPYPTPLKLSDDMQTPGTVYPIHSENSAHGEKARIRSQYVYHVLNPVQNFSQLMALKKADYDSEQVVSLRESEQSEHGTSECSVVSHRKREDALGKEAVDASLSNWLKPSSSPKNDLVQNCGSASTGGSHSGKTSDMDRPILGTVAAHWNDEESSRISPKWWDGNGIPNSTNKYKEDQKVSWHATPFEERLEKALTNESLISPRRLSIEPYEFVENEESDTAVSRLQASKHREPVVSF